MAAPKRGRGRPRKEPLPGVPNVIETTVESSNNTPPEIWQPLFLEALRKKPNVTHACKVAKVTRRRAYLARERDAEFKAEWDDAQEEGRDVIELAMIEAAHAGDYKSREFLLHKWRYSSSILKSKTDEKIDDPKTITVQWGK